MRLLNFGSGGDSKFEIYTEHEIEEINEIEKDEESDNSMTDSLNSMSDSDEEVMNIKKRKLLLHEGDCEMEENNKG